MKKRLLKRAGALLLSIVLLGTYFSEGINFMAAANTFTGFSEGQGTVQDNADGSHLITFNSGYTSVTSNYKIDLTQGFKWNYVDAQFGLHLSFKEDYDKAATPFMMAWLLNDTDVATDLLFYPGDACIGVASRNTFTGLNFNVGDSTTAELEMIFKKEEISGASYYKLYINGVEGHICYPEATFKALNNYNASTGEYEGAHIGVSIEGAPLSISIAPIINNTSEPNTFTGFGEGQGTVEDKIDGSHLITFNSGYTSVTSNYKIDLTQGFKWNYVDAQFGLHLSFKEDYDKAATPFMMAWLLNDTDVATDLLFYPGDACIGVASRNTFTGLNFNVGDSTTTELEMIFKQEEISGASYYKLYINGVEGHICYPEATFNALNNYNASTGKFEGAHIGVSIEGIALSISIAPIINNTSELNTFTGFGEGQGTVQDNADGSHLITFNSGYTSVTSNYKIDLTQGFKWNYVDAQFGLHLSFKEDYDKAATPFMMAWLLNDTDVATDLLFYPGDACIGVASRNTFTGLNFNVGDSTTTELEMIFKQEEISGASYYKLYINGVEGHICYPEATFNALNNYNASTGEYEGAHIGVSIEGAPLSISIAPIADNTQGEVGDTFEFLHSSNGTVTTRDNGWHDIVFKQTYAKATSNYKIDLTRGFQWQYTDAFWGLHISFLKEHNAEPYPFRMSWLLNDTDIATDMLFYPDESRNKVGMAARGGYMGLNDWQGDSPTALLDMTFKKQIISNAVYYVLYINEVRGGVAYTEAEFKDLNNYNEGTGTYEGCYLSVYTEGGTGAFGIYANRDTIPSDKPFVGKNASTAQTKAPYDLTVAASEAAKSTFTVDLKRGLCFNLSEWPKSGCDWVTVGFSGSYWLMNMEPNGRDENTYAIQLKNKNGKIVAKMGDSDPTDTDLSITEDHVISFKYEDATGGYRAYIDNIPLKGNASVIFVNKFNEVNNYYAVIKGFNGAFIRFAAGSDFTIKNIIEVTNENAFVETTAGFSLENDKIIYHMLFSGNDTAIATWKTDLTRGILLSLDELSNNSDEYIELAFMGNYADAAAAYSKSIRLRQKNGRLYASVWDGKTEAYATDFGKLFNETHILKAIPVTSMGVTTYHITLDDKEFTGIFAIAEDDFKKLANFNKATIRFDGTYIKFAASDGARLSVFAHADEAFVSENGVYYNLADDKYSLALNDNQSAISTYDIDLVEGIAFTVDELKDLFSVRLSNSLWNMLKGTASGSNVQPVIKIKDVNGRLNVSISNDPNTDHFVSIAGKIADEHTIEFKKKTVAGVGDVYKFYFDGFELDNGYYLTVEQFNLLNNYNAATNTFSGAVFCMKTGKAIDVKNICSATPFEGSPSFSYSEPTENHYNLTFVGTSYERGVSRWKADLTAGLSFNVTNASGWIMLRFANTFNGMYMEVPGTTINNYQPMIRLEQWGEGRILTSVKIGEGDRYITYLENFNLVGTHFLTAKLVSDEKTGVKVYKFFLDGMEICKGFTMSQGIFKKINGYDKETDTFVGTHILFTSQNGATIENVHELTVGKTTEKNGWKTNTNADATKVSENVYDFDMKALSSLRANKMVDMEKGMTFTVQSSASNLQFGMALSMMPESILLDVPPIVSDEYGLSFTFTKNSDNTYSIRSSTGLYATYNGDLAGTHTYSFVKIKNKDGEERYTLAIDGKAIFDDGMDLETYLMMSNASKGLYPTIFAMNDLTVKNLTGVFTENKVINTDDLWNDDFNPDDDEPKKDESQKDEPKKDESKEEAPRREDLVDDNRGDDEYEDIDKPGEEPETERVLVKKVKIEQNPIIKYVINWWIVVIVLAAVGLIAVGVITFVPFKKKEKKD